MPSDQLHSDVSLGPGDAVVFSDRALYETYNFHDPDALQRLAGWLARGENEDGPGVAVVAGRPGIGRDYFVRAAVWKAGERGVRVRHARLSFDGFDPDHHASLTAFADHQLRLRLAPGGDLPSGAVDKRGALVGLAGALPSTFLSAAGLSFLAAAAFSALDLQSLTRPGTPVLAGPRASAEDRLRAILDFVTRTERLVLVLPADEISEPAVQWFVHEPRRNRRLSVVLSTARVPDAQEVYGEPLAHVTELRQMTPQSLRERVELRLGVSDFPDSFYAGLWKRTQGVPGQVALSMMFLAGNFGYPDPRSGELIARGGGPGRPWRLTVEPDDERLVEYFSSHFYEQLNQFRNQQRPIDRHVLRFVELAALCGSIAPPRLIASYMGLTDAERDDLLDRVDALEEAGRPVFVSLDYQHPTFRGAESTPELVYRFADESNRLIVVRRMVGKAAEARKFLAWLAGRLPVGVRASSELLASLSAHLEPGARERAEYERRLRWWTDAEEAQAMTEILSESVRARELDWEILWTTASAHLEWPAARRMALLDAMQADPGGIPLHVLAYYHHARASLLYQLGRFGNAQEACESGFDAAVPGDLGVVVSLHSIAYTVARELCQREVALVHAQEDYRLTLESGQRDARVAFAAGRLAAGLLQAGRGEEAHAYVDQALAFVGTEEDEEWDIGLLMNELGLAFKELGDHDRALDCYRRSLQADENLSARRGYSNSDHAMSLFNLGFTLYERGEIDEAYRLLGSAAEIATEVSGPQHPAYGKALIVMLYIDLERSNEPGIEECALALRQLIENGTEEVNAVLLADGGGLLFSGVVMGSLSPQVRELVEALPRQGEGWPGNSRGSHATG